MTSLCVDSLLETVFFGGEEGGLEDRPHPRFQWKPPGENAPQPPPAAAAPTAPDEMDDRTGKYSMSDLLPKGEVATSDDLIDFFARIRDAKGKKKKSWEKEFAAHRSEFESKIHAFVDKLLTETVCDECGQEVGDRFFADKSRSGKKINVCGTCYMQKDEHGDPLGGQGPDSFDAPEYQSYTPPGSSPRL
jgi:hypothetical protein